MKNSIQIGNNYLPRPSASDLILDVLSGYGPEGLDVQALCRAGAVMDISESNVRVSLNRLAKQKKIVSPKRGFYAVNTQGYLLHGDVGNWWRRDELITDWRGSWAAVSERAAGSTGAVPQRKHSRALEMQGFRKFRKGLLVRPNNLVGGVDSLRKKLIELGLLSSAMVFRMEELSPQDETAARSLWLHDDFPAAYEQYLQVIRQSAQRLNSISINAAAQESLILGRSAIRFIVYDPLLPEELLSAHPRQVLIRELREYQIRARELWANFISESHLDNPSSKQPEIRDVFMFQNIT